MRSVEPEGLERVVAARALALYLLSLAAVALALQAWDAGSPLRLFGWAALLALALPVGAALEGPFGQLAPTRRLRYRVMLGALQAGVTLVLPLALLVPDPRLLRQAAGLLSALQVLLLALSGLSSSPAGVLANALALSVLAALGGGALAGLASLCVLTLVGLFLALDRVARLREAYPPSPGPGLGFALREAAAGVGPAALGLVAWLLAFPPARHAGFVLESDAATREATAAAYRLLALTALLGGGAVFTLSRLLGRGRHKPPGGRELVEPLPEADEALETPVPRPPVAPPGRRGRVVRAYLAMLAQAARRGHARHPAQTPVEFATALAEPGPALARLTSLFVRARYGFGEPSEHEALAAESDARELQERLARLPARRRARSGVSAAR